MMKKRREKVNRFSITRFPLEEKTVFLRVDYNVPLENPQETNSKRKLKRKKTVKIADNKKIKASLPTIKFLLKKNCKIVLATHLGRSQGKFNSELKVDPLVKELRKLLPREKITKLSDCLGKEIKNKIKRGKEKQIFFLENLRFYKEEEKNNSMFAHSLANFADVYVNDAFAVSHRKHASLAAITKFLPSVAGLLVEKELYELNKALRPRKPAVWVMGGAKLNKISLIEQALRKADYLLIGGALAFAFLKAKGIPVGMSKIDLRSVRVAKKILKKRAAKKIILPIDFMVTKEFSYRAKSEIVKYNQIGPLQISLDLGPETVKLFKRYLRKAHTIVWNGPLGYFEWTKFALATKEIARYMGMLTAVSICGGGETEEAIKKFHLEHKLTHVSTGGGATLTYLAGRKLISLEALKINYKKFKKLVK